jgi:nucleoside-diphosphate-sugar epimerase
MPDALIGFTGFVGGNLRRQRPFDDLYRSTNIGELAGRSYNTIVCAGAPAEKWKANQDPDGDRAALATLRDALRDCQADEMILISTVDVYGRPIEVDEATPVDTQGLHPYGLHRYELERFARDHFPRVLIARLPGLFGKGLKKNIIYDFLNHNNVDRIHSQSVYQFYGLDRLWADLETARTAGLDLIHLTTEPVSVAEIARHAFGLEFHQAPEGVAPARYDFRTRHAALYGASGRYLIDKAAILAAIREFVATERNPSLPST